MIVYKVVRRAKNGRMYSFNSSDRIDAGLVGTLPSELRVEYVLKEETIPEIGKLFAFVSLKSAWEFVKRFESKSNVVSLKSNIMLLKCHACNAKKPKFDNIPLPQSLENLLGVWNTIANGTSRNFLGLLYSIPEGTVFCDKITPLEKVTIKL